jgi:DNA polymerase-3 subunit delta'
MLKNDVFYGRPGLINPLFQAFCQGRVVHAYLITGPQGSGKRTLARRLAAIYLCESQADKPCGVCRSCVEIASESHPDLWVVRASKATIGVDEVRFIVRDITVKPFYRQRRVIIIEQAHLLTPQAQNALLKTIEEPVEGNVFLLTATNAASLLPTIVSRTRPIQVGSLPEHMAVEALEARGISSERARMLAAVSNRIIGVALDMNADERYFALRDQALELLGDRFAGSRIPEIYNGLSKMDDKQDQILFLNALETIIADLRRMSIGLDVRNIDKKNVLSGLISRFTIKNLDVMIDEVMDIRVRMRSNVAWQTAIERFVFLLSDINSAAHSGQGA